ncbi:MAG: hypothetical protein KKD33_06750, partial [Verrucomicrobia bacterium]|nr:hypothetical protein [Verrucomicrobiota bacterium]
LGFESSWSVPAAVRCLPRYELTSHSWTQVWHHAFNRGAYFPDSYETLFKYDAVIMTCGDVGRLLAIGRDMLRRYVQEGGGLVMLGGYYSYGKGHVRNTRFGELLPVQADSQWDLAQTPDTDIDNARLWFGLFPFPKGWKPSAYWIHRVKVRPEARVVWTCGGQPAVCVWNCGKGRVVTITLTPLGAPPAGASLFCQTPEWPSVLAQMLQWAGENGMAK